MPVPDLPPSILTDSGVSVRDVLSTLSRAQTGAVILVDDDRRLVGRVDDAAVFRALLDGAALDDPVAPLVEPAPLVVGADADRADVLDLMRARSIRIAPAVDDTGHVLHLHAVEELVGARELPNWAVVMAGGRGRRLAPLTDEVPKPMLPVAGRPILERLVLHLVGAGIRTVLLAVHYRREQVEAHFGDGSAFGCAIRYLREPPERPLGSGGALGLLGGSGGEPKDPVLVLNGDLVMDLDVQGLLADHAASGAVATMAAAEHAHEVPFGVVETGARGLERLVEKPVCRWRVNAGVYVMEPRLLARVPTRLPYPITELFQDCLARGERVGVWQLHGAWQDVGRPAELASARGQQ